LITREQIAAVVGDCKEYAPDFTKKEKVKSPGVLYKHYSPRCETVLFDTDKVPQAVACCENEKRKGKRVAVLCEEGLTEYFQDTAVLSLGRTDVEMANRLYGLLRQSEKVCDILIAVEPRQKEGVMVGVLNRLRKACTSQDIQH
jgi:hypothetical protein